MARHGLLAAGTACIFVGIFIVAVPLLFFNACITVPTNVDAGACGGIAIWFWLAVGFGALLVLAGFLTIMVAGFKRAFG